MTDSIKPIKTNFIRNIINEDLLENKTNGQVITRFPPEPNGYLHIGHAKSICLNFGIAKDYNKGPCHLRFDDTNPENESNEYIQAIKKDISWLGFDWGEHLYFASNYFDKLYETAVGLIKTGKAYVCSLNPDEVRLYRGTLTQAGKDSPNRNRPIAENLDLFAKMKNGEFEDGTYTLRAKIDMTSGNMNLRDPAIYRIKRAIHHNTGSKWCIYPMYDYTHPISDALENITHSLCTLEFQDHKPLYNWFIENCNMTSKPQQYEFSRLNLNYTITSKRKLKSLVDNNMVLGWDDPRMPTISGLRRRGVTAKSIVEFCETVGISKQESIIDISIFEDIIRNDLNVTASRKMGVLKPLKVVINNFDEAVQTLNAPNHPQNADLGRRNLSFAKEIYIEQDDFAEVPTKGFKRLIPKGRVRLMNAYVIECHSFNKDDAGNITELHCTILPETLAGKKPSDGSKVKGIIHWVDATNCIDAEVRVYDRLFNTENPTSFDDLGKSINPNSLEIIKHAKLELSLSTSVAGEKFQFNRIGYFCADVKDHTQAKPVFNRIVTLRDNWQKK